MTHETEAPDPMEELLSIGDVLPKTIGLDEFVAKVKNKPWCLAGGTGDHEECEPFERLDEALLLAKTMGISIHDIITDKRAKMNVGMFLCKKFRACACVDGQKMMIDGAEKELLYDTDFAAYLVSRIKFLEVPLTGVRRIQPNVPQMYWVKERGAYGVQNDDNCWQCESKDDAHDRLVAAGVSPLPYKGELSEVYQALLNVRNEFAVDMMMPLAGYTTGVHQIKGQQVLVPSSFHMIEPIEDPKNEYWKHIWAVISGLLGDQSVQVDHFITKMKNDRACLLASLKNGGLALLIAGDAGIGKTLLLDHIIVPALGGRSANVFAYLSGATSFCKEQAGSEVWFIDDGNPFTSWEARRAFANAIKQTVASAEVWAHGKGKDGRTLPLYRRLVVLTNIDSLEAMPEMEESLNDKIMLLKAFKFEMPKELTPLPPMYDVVKLKEFGAILDRELPYFLDYVDHYDAPDYCKGSRFGVPYKNPELWESIKELGRDSEVHYLVQRLVYGVFGQGKGESEKRPDGSYEYETNALISALLECRHTATRAKVYVQSSKSFGCHLAQLKRSQLGKFYSARRSNGKSYWTIKRDETLKHPKIVDEDTE